MLPTVVDPVSVGEKKVPFIYRNAFAFLWEKISCPYICMCLFLDTSVLSSIFTPISHCFN